MMIPVLLEQIHSGASFGNSLGFNTRESRKHVVGTSCQYTQPAASVHLLLRLAVDQVPRGWPVEGRRRPVASLRQRSPGRSTWHATHYRMKLQLCEKHPWRNYRHGNQQKTMLAKVPDGAPLELPRDMVSGTVDGVERHGGVSDYSELRMVSATASASRSTRSAIAASSPLWRPATDSIWRK